MLVAKYGYDLVKIITDNVFIVTDRKNKYIFKKFNNITDFETEIYYYDITKKYNIQPDIIDIYDKNNIIIYELMHPVLNDDGDVINNEILSEEFFDMLDYKISIIHRLGFAHGDLSLHNVVFSSNYEPFLIDFEKSFHIDNHSWKTELWLRDYYNWEDSYADFVNNDYMMYRNDLYIYKSKYPILNNAPRDYVSLNEEYYKIRFFISNLSEYLTGECGTFVKYLQDKIGGTIYGISIKNQIPMHYVLKDKYGNYIDATGLYRNEKSMLTILKSIFEDDIGYDIKLKVYVVDQYTLDNIDYECSQLTDKLMDDIDYVIDKLNNT